MSTAKADRASYKRALNWLWGAVHELPSGVLWGANGATAAECEEMLEGLYEFERLCNRLDLSNHGVFVEGCRWHFEHYPHFLERRTHFADYATYVTDRGGPLCVSLPDQQDGPRDWARAPLS